MKKRLFLLCLLAFVQLSIAQEVMQFKVSKPYCVFNFMETMTTQQGVSPTLREYIVPSVTKDSVFRQLCVDFKNLKLDYHYQLEGYPANRNSYRSTKDLLIIALVNANTIAEFKQKSIGILPHSEQQKLVTLLEQAAAYYDVLIWKDHAEKLEEQREKLEAYVPQSTELFDKIRHFYRSTWTADIPFLVSIYPIPGQRGISTATPHANSLCIGVLTDDTRGIERMGVVFHEMCHTLFNEQTPEFQQQIEQWFEASTSPYKHYAYTFFDEALATAIGNGWVHKNISGSLPTTDWYHNEYINGFAKELYPSVEEYMAKQQQIDQSFIDQAIALFAAKFPDTRTDYGVLLNRVSIYSDAATNTERMEIRTALGSHFQMTHISLSSPILDPQSLESLKNSTQTQVIVINKNHQETLSALKELFPQLSKIAPTDLTDHTLLSFYDKGNRPIVILYALDDKGVQTLAQKMKALKFFDAKKIIQSEVE
ncbi:hypothetical protein [Myroides fluvii]|uniref:hypothetical protein n=1 Tax=Myroides fluvii TaxID=2572594 RepID=UPI00131E8CB6|nr:hypothetical protein [Myroides fluvii]